jgi:hypothetical protein
MPIIVDTPKYAAKALSVEQVALNDYGYFAWLIDNYKVPRHLRQRFNLVEHVANDFVSKESCSLSGCKDIPRYISIYESHGDRVNYGGYVYCSEKHFHDDPSVSDQGKGHLYRLGFRSGLSHGYGKKSEIKDLVYRVADSMGLDRSHVWTKQYLEDFFNSAETWDGHKQVDLFS